MSEIIETLIKAQRYVKSRGGEFTAKIWIFDTEVIDIQVYFKRRRRGKEHHFGISTHLERFDELQEGLEMLLDTHFGPGWRESEAGEVFKCIVCGKTIEGRVIFCEFCHLPVCEECVCYSEEPYYGCNVFCLDCWVK